MPLVTVTSVSEYRFNKRFMARKLAAIVAEALSVQGSEQFSLFPSDIRVELFKANPDQFGFPAVALDVIANRCDELVETLPARKQQIIEAIKSVGLFPAATHGSGRIEVWLRLVDGAWGDSYPSP